MFYGSVTLTALKAHSSSQSSTSGTVHSGMIKCQAGVKGYHNLGSHSGQSAHPFPLAFMSKLNPVMYGKNCHISAKAY